MKIYLIGALIGAIIGYITNWLAIKMLFRPREAKYIFGMKVPFTPGLIPKEKSRIANKVGETVGTHLLNSDSLSKALKNDRVKTKFDAIAKEKIRSIIESDSTIEASLKKLLGEGYYSVKEDTISSISNAILTSIQDENFKNKVKFQIVEVIKEQLNKKPEKITEFINSERFKEIIKEALSEEKTSKAIEKVILKELKSLEVDERSVGEIIPEKLKPCIEEYIKSQKDTLAEIIRRLVRDEEVSYKIKAAINENIPSIVSMFLNGDVIYGKVVSLIDNALEKDENKEYLCDAALVFVNESMKKKVSDITNNIGEEKLQVISESLGGRISSKVFGEENTNILIDKINVKFSEFNSYDEILKKLFGEYESTLIMNIDLTISRFVNDSRLIYQINEVIEKVFDKFLQNTLKDICYNRQKLEDNITGVLDNLYNDFVDNKSSKVLEIVDISSIVEEQINAFEVDYAEEIILGIANKELKAITWLGALLGGVLGILSPLLSTMYM
ncbi:DUF445 family protein [Clostridium sp. B9]|uniref:DUF445 family protein n=1 Tax=Clostridium sp. B9 TaxID=3423224 RepID=UPI003D2F3EC8